MPIVDPKKCVGCQTCIRNCPVGAISLKDGKAFIDQSLCIKCGACVEICPIKAIQSGTELKPENKSQEADEISEKQIDSTLEEYKEYAEKKGYSLNTNKKTVRRIVKGLLKNEMKYGMRYCPCRFVSGDKEADKKNICPCIYHEEEIKTQGCCYCKLLCK